MHASSDQQDLTNLAMMVRAWRERGDALPVAVVVSVFDDLLSSEPNGKGSQLALDDVTIDQLGFAHATRDPSLAGLGPLLSEVLGDDDAPAAARSLMDRLVSDDPDDHPIDAEQFRQWMRDSLGAPAAREEVVACAQEATGDLPMPEALDDDDEVHNQPTEIPGLAMAESAIPIAQPVTSDTPAPVSASALGDPTSLRGPAEDSEIPGVTELPASAEIHSEPPASAEDGATEVAMSAPIPVPEPADDGDRVVTLPPERPATENQLSTDVVRARESDPPTALPSPLPSTAEPEPETQLETPEAASELDSNDLPRPVVRHPKQPRRGVSVVSAPAARKSARASAHGRDSILVPAEQRRGWGWVTVIAVLAVAVYFLILR